MLELLIAFFVGIPILLILAMKNKRRPPGERGASHSIRLPKIEVPYKQLIWPVGIVILGLIVVYFWPTSEPGKALAGTIGLSESSDWWNWFRWWIPLAIVTLLAVRAFKVSPISPTSVNSGGNGWLLPIGVTLIIVALAAYNLIQLPQEGVALDGGDPVVVNLRTKASDTKTIRINQELRVLLPQAAVGMIDIVCTEFSSMPDIAKALKGKRAPMLVKTSMGPAYDPTFALSQQLKELLQANNLSGTNLVIERRQVDPSQLFTACPEVYRSR